MLGERPVRWAVPTVPPAAAPRGLSRRARRPGDRRCAAPAVAGPRPPLGLPRRVAPGPTAGEALPVEDEHVGHGPLEEGAVVADDDQRAGPVVEEVLERAQRVEVEVVGGLVEQQHVRLLGQREQQLHPPALPAGQQS